MDAEEIAELVEEAAALRQRVGELSELVADYRARALDRETIITRLRRELQAERLRQSAPDPAANEA